MQYMCILKKKVESETIEFICGVIFGTVHKYTKLVIMCEFFFGSRRIIFFLKKKSDDNNDKREWIVYIVLKNVSSRLASSHIE